MYLNNPENMQILFTEFKNNTVSNDSSMLLSGVGGGLYYTCSDKNLCKVIVSNDSSFINNSADSSGGGVMWD